MGSPNPPNLDKESLKALRYDLAQIAELRSQLEMERLKQYAAQTGEAVIGVLADHQRQTLRALVAIGFSVCLFLLALNVRSWWGIALSAWIPAWILFSTRLSRKDKKNIERVELLRCLARGADNFRRDVRLKLLHAFETGEFLGLEKSEADLYDRLDHHWGDDITEVLCPVLRLTRYPGFVHSAKYERLGPIYENLCDLLLERGGDGPPTISLTEKSLREMHAACFGPNAAKDHLGLEDYEQKP